MDIKNKTIILTGAARVGKSVAKMLGERGANLVITYLRSKKEADVMCEKCKEVGSQAIEVCADLSKAHDIANVVREAKRAFGRIDGLVHMAASYPRTPWETLTEEDWERTMDVIAKSTFLLGKMVGDELLKDEENAEVLSHTPLARWGGPDEIAKAVLYFFDADFVTGVVLPVDGGRTIG